MTYTEEQLALANEQIPRVDLNEYNNDKNSTRAQMLFLDK